MQLLFRCCKGFGLLLEVQPFSLFLEFCLRLEWENNFASLDVPAQDFWQLKCSVSNVQRCSNAEGSQRRVAALTVLLTLSCKGAKGKGALYNLQYISTGFHHLA